MFECIHCNLFFEEKRLLINHNKTKKCMVHKNLNFSCKKCFKSFQGYDNSINHVNSCQEQISEKEMVIEIANKLSSHYQVDIIFDDDLNGVIKFKKIYNYIHPNKLNQGINIPQKQHMFEKIIKKSTDANILGSHNLYLNDIYNKIFRLNDTFQLLSLKYNFIQVFQIIFFDSMSCFYLKDNDIYVLGKIQCQNNDCKKWFGDTFVLKNEEEKIVKCIWYKDPYLKQFFSLLNPLLKDLLNLYLNLGNWSLKKKKIKLRNNDNISSNISSVMEEFNLTNLIETIKILSTYDTFYSLLKENILKKDKINSNLFTNILNVFKDEILPSTFINEELSLMTMNEPDFVGGNFYHLMYYILPESEKLIFKSKV